MANPSRMDTKQLMSGYAGSYFNDECLSPEANRWQCDIRTLDTLDKPFLDGTKCILALGAKTLSVLGRDGYTLGEQRGSPFTFRNIPVIASYLPQEAIDPQPYEARLNPLAKIEIDEEDEDDTGKSRHGRTAPSNWKYWLKCDTKKSLRIVKDPSLLITKKPEFNINYPAAEIINTLNNHSNAQLYFDIETDTALNILCFSFSFGDGVVWGVPLLRCSYRTNYDITATCNILRAFCLASYRNRLVIHNSQFDLFVLSHRYRLIFGGDIYDTMLAMHRCFPELEKSLGHGVSYWTYEPYHKDEGAFMPVSETQEHKLWDYCCKDVWTMQLIREAIDKFASADPGLMASIEQANSQCKPYLINTLMGMRYNNTELQRRVSVNDAYMTQYLRIASHLVGRDFLPSSSPQCVKYFINELGYPIYKRGKNNNPGCDEKAIQRYRLKFPENPMLTLTLMYRRLKKETGSLGFKPWKEDAHTI